MQKNELTIKQIQKKDLSQARKFAAKGMHLSWYVRNWFELYFYSKYVLYLELLKSTTVLGAYSDNRLVGCLFAQFKNETTVYNSLKYKIYCRLFSALINLFGYRGVSDTYDKANKEMLENFKANTIPDGEITFFAVNTALKGKGIGTLLLNNLVEKNKGKFVYLYTDSGSTYQFYLHRGFKESGKKEIIIPAGKEGLVPLTCFLFSKRF